jgi:tetratricopeptide (TPR) repeat protein
LISGTLVLVLYVLPERYVISAGFRESGLSFPTPVTPFLPVPEVSVRARPLPEPPAPPSDATAGPADAVAGAPEPEAAPQDDRLLLARELRDLGETDAAAAAYAVLSAESPDDTALRLEWALAHAWAGEHERAAELLREALTRAPSSISLRVELARAYFSLGRVLEADATLAELDHEALVTADALELRESLNDALRVPPTTEAQPTRVELAARARAALDFAGARAHLADALAESPDDADAWQAYADLLEYELADFEGAREALLEVMRLRGPDASDELRLARLAIWTERSAEAAERLESLLASLDRALPADEADSERTRALRAETLALLGDLHRWAGDRLRASSHYVLALGEDDANARAHEGLAALDAEVARQIAEVESPRRGARASTLADTDDFARTDLALEWVEVSADGWVWGGAVGNRWLGGVDLGGGLSADRQGLFVELSGARWWRSGTVRTELSAGTEHMRSTWDVALGASATHRGLEGRVTELRVEHGPAHVLTNTLQSVSAHVVHERVVLEHARPLGEAASLVVSLDAARLHAEAASGPAPTVGSDATTRLQASLTASHTLTGSVSLGLTGQALGFLDAAPSGTLPGGGTLDLFWDPRLAVSAGPFARLDHEVAPGWTVTGRIAPGLALVDERGTSGFDLVPHLATEAGLVHEGSRVRAALDVFLYQGQFDGYRSYGMRLTVGALTLPTLGGS